MNNDNSIIGAGEKTGTYGPQMVKGEVPPGATGVNDFRWFHELGFTNPDGSAQSAGNHVTGAANHNWGHYETALATDRARGGPPGIGHNGGPALAPLHGRTDWTGEQIQALGWVRQKAHRARSASPSSRPSVLPLWRALRPFRRHCRTISLPKPETSHDCTSTKIPTGRLSSAS